MAVRKLARRGEGIYALLPFTAHAGPGLLLPAAYHGGSQAGRVTKNEPHERGIVLSLERLSGKACVAKLGTVWKCLGCTDNATSLGLRFLLRFATHLERERIRGRKRERERKTDFDCNKSERPGRATVLNRRTYRSRPRERRLTRTGT